jgi:hypothetical protein
MLRRSIGQSAGSKRRYAAIYVRVTSFFEISLPFKNDWQISIAIQK